MQLVHANS
jgi:hypothetical protein